MLLSSRLRRTPGCRTSRRRSGRFAPGYRQRQSLRSPPGRGTEWPCCIFRIDGEVNKRRRGVIPLLKVHGIGENRHHAVGTCRYAAGHLFEESIRIHPRRSATSFSSAQKASRNQRMVRPVKKLIDSACAMPGMTCGLMRIFICGSVRTSGRFTTCCQKVPPAPRFGRRVPPPDPGSQAAHRRRP